MMYQTKLDERYITNHLIYNEKPAEMLLGNGQIQTYEQMSLADWIPLS